MTTATDLLSEIGATRALNDALAEYSPEKRRELRQSQHISGTHVAEYLGVVPNTFMRYERGEFVPRNSGVLERYLTLLRVLDGELEAIPTNDTGAN
jgi:transcriptional regulator with XRE-family HTH domain